MATFRRVGDSIEFSSAAGAGEASPGTVEISGVITSADDGLEKRVVEGFAIWLDVAAEDALHLYQGITQTWENKPTFARTPAGESGQDISLSVGLAPGSIRESVMQKGNQERLLPGEIFSIMDRGSESHPIDARVARRVSRLVKTARGTIIMTSPTKPMLHFRVPFSPKTTPGKLSSGGGSRGETWRVTERIEDHPGTEPRGYSLAIAELVQDAMESTASTLIASMILNRISARQAAGRIKGAIRRGISMR